ncbi:hypothetical protein EHYA_06896 [Embleya hyalina]|uniref:Uncharacterized protein n=2 Tax=Embleya hyalina TaxID=516124 RepID=A0A401YX47_9ACTN|nr:hypothetical protein EHYA_06896 [Embleya hyalina]
MTTNSRDRLALEDTVRSLTAEAVELEARVTELRRALTGIDERMRTVFDALDRFSRSGEHVGG